VQFLLALHDSAGVVTGTGNWANEAGPSGSLVPRGTATVDSIHLQIIYVPNPAFTTLKPDTAQLEAGAHDARSNRRDAAARVVAAVDDSTRACEGGRSGRS
jgi:hypothetical protein